MTWRERRKQRERERDDMERKKERKRGRRTVRKRQTVREREERVPRMAPTAHTSTPLVYRVDPNRISGARYHLVALRLILFNVRRI